MPVAPLAARLRDRFYSSANHPYRLFERQIEAFVAANPSITLLDAGCGRSAPVLRHYRGKAERLIGVEVVDFTDVPTDIETYKADLAHIPLPDDSVDIVISRSVFEHLVDPEAVYKELARILRPGGKIIVLTANLWDYGTLAARLVPNRFHARLVRFVEGRPEEDTFPTAYRTNTRRDIERLATGCGLRLARLEYHSQYPNYLLFSGVAFFFGMCFEKVIARVQLLRGLRGWLLFTLEKGQDRGD